jgi:hypothetical protein
MDVRCLAGIGGVLRHARAEMRLIRYPFLLGAGTPLFKVGGARRPLVRLETADFSSGATLQRYRLR